LSKIAAGVPAGAHSTILFSSVNKKYLAREKNFISDPAATSSSPPFQAGRTAQDGSNPERHLPLWQCPPRAWKPTDQLDGQKMMIGILGC